MVAALERHSASQWALVPLEWAAESFSEKAVPESCGKHRQVPCGHTQGFPSVSSRSRGPLRSEGTWAVLDEMME